MQDQPNETVAEQARRTEQTILILLLTKGQNIWSVEELVSEIGPETGRDQLPRRSARRRAHPSLQRFRAPNPSSSTVRQNRSALRAVTGALGLLREKWGSGNCLSTYARRRADANGRKAAAPASAARPRAVRTAIRPIVRAGAGRCSASVDSGLADDKI